MTSEMKCSSDSESSTGQGLHGRGAECFQLATYTDALCKSMRTSSFANSFVPSTIRTECMELPPLRASQCTNSACTHLEHNRFLYLTGASIPGGSVGENLEKLSRKTN